MALRIDDITQFTGSNYGIYRFQAKAVDTTGVYADSDLSNVEIYNIPLLNLELNGKIVTITGFIDGVTSVKIYLDNVLVSTLTRTTEESLTYAISDDVNPNEVHKIYAVAEGTGINENMSNAVIYGILPTFADNSWETISAISSQISKLDLTGDLLYDYIKQNYGWEVGMTKPVTLISGDNFNLQIWDFNDKVDKNGNKIGISFGSVELQKQGAQMNSTNTNVGGFGASAMAQTTLPSIYELLPRDLQDVIKESKITYHSGNDDPSTERVGYYKLYLPSEYEISHTTTYALQEGVWLKYWQEHNTNNDRIKYRIGRTTPNAYWLRSANRSNSSNFAYVFSSGDLSNNSANSSWGVCVCLSI